MTKKYCACGKELREVIEGSFIWLCDNEKWPHLWEGVPGGLMSGLEHRTSRKLAAEVLRLRDIIEKDWVIHDVIHISDGGDVYTSKDESRTFEKTVSAEDEPSME